MGICKVILDVMVDGKRESRELVPRTTSRVSAPALVAQQSASNYRPHHELAAENARLRALLEQKTGATVGVPAQRGVVALPPQQAAETRMAEHAYSPMRNHTFADTDKERWLHNEVTKYKAMFEAVQHELHQTQSELRLAAIREDRVEKMIAWFASMGVDITTDSQGNVIVSGERASVLLPTGFGLTEARVLPKG